MSTSTSLLNLNHGQPGGASTIPLRPSPSHAAAGSRDETLQKAIQEYVEKLPDDDKEAFKSAPDIIERLQEMQSKRKSLISSSLTSRVEKVLQFVNSFMVALSNFTQQSSEISLVVGGAKCILTVCPSNIYLLLYKLVTRVTLG